MGKRKSYFHKKGDSEREKKAKLKFGESFNKLDVNQRGFLITYNCKFTFCLNESKKLLQQFSLPLETNKKDGEENKETDLEKELQEELNSLNKRDKEFTVLDTGAKYTIFINLESVNPNGVVEAIFEYMEETKKPLGRYIQRLLPIANTCKAHLEDIEKCIKKTLDEFETIKNSNSELGEDIAKPFKYCCVWKTSNNSSLKREDVFRIVGTYFQEKNKANKVNFDEPDYVLILHVICNMCFISFVKNYFQYKKYNFIEQGSKFNGLVDNKAKAVQPKSTEKKISEDLVKNESENTEKSETKNENSEKKSSADLVTNELKNTEKNETKNENEENQIKLFSTDEKEIVVENENNESV